MRIPPNPTTHSDEIDHPSEKRKALERWAGKMDSILDGDHESAEIIRIA
jgi:hypothetical protein